MARATLEVDLDSFQESQNWMIHAIPGQGKTIWSTGAPNFSLWSAEPGAISAKNYGRSGGLARIKTWADAVRCRDDLLSGAYDHRTWIIIDTVSSIQQKNQNSVLDKAASDNPKQDPDIPAVQHYLKQQNSLKRWVEQIVDYPGVNKIWLAHSLRIEDQDGGVQLIPTILGGADKGYPIAHYVMGLMNTVGYMEMRSKKDAEGKSRMVRRILWQPYENPDTGVRYLAKDHFGALGMFTDNKTFPQHLEMVEAKKATNVETPAAAPKKAAPRRGRAAATEEE
jgi:hypothetical protein